MNYLLITVGVWLCPHFGTLRWRFSLFLGGKLLRSAGHREQGQSGVTFQGPHEWWKVSDEEDVYVLLLLYLKSQTKSFTNMIWLFAKFSYFRMVEIAASHYAHISAAMSETGKVFMWGQCRGQSLTSPMLTKFTCTDDVFSAFSSPLVTWRTYTIGECISRHITRSSMWLYTSTYKYLALTGIHLHGFTINMCPYL